MHDYEVELSGTQTEALTSPPATGWVSSRAATAREENSIPSNPPNRLKFDATVIEWRGPSPFFFAPLPPDLVDAIRAAAKLVSYGWGMIPVEATIAGVTFETSLFPKNGGYLLPVKSVVRKAKSITAGDKIKVTMTIQPRRR